MLLWQSAARVQHCQAVSVNTHTTRYSLASTTCSLNNWGLLFGSPKCVRRQGCFTATTDAHCWTTAFAHLHTHSASIIIGIEIIIGGVIVNIRRFLGVGKCFHTQFSYFHLCRLAFCCCRYVCALFSVAFLGVGLQTLHDVDVNVGVAVRCLSVARCFHCYWKTNGLSFVSQRSTRKYTCGNNVRHIKNGINWKSYGAIIVLDVTRVFSCKFIGGLTTT